MNKIYYIISLVILLTGVSSSLHSQTWYDEADTRIDQLRKGDFKLRVYDEMDNVFTDSIKISMVKHEFPWGTVIPIKGADDYLWGRAVAVKYFNYGVTGNDFKWPWLEPTQGVPYYDKINEVLEWTEKVDFGFRGHALIWGGDQSWQMPPWTLSSSITPAQIYDACETHIRRDVGYFKGRVDEYDVVNEPSPGHETWLAETVGDSINWDSFKWARETDTNAKLYVNDYNIIVWDAAPAYRTTIQAMLNHGAPIDGIGVQGHMSGSINWNDIKTKLDYMAELGLPVRVTEFDMEIDANKVSEQQQANEYAEMMRTIFSHPATNGFVFWCFSDNDAYRAGSGIYTENKVPKIAADTVFHLIHEKWTTQLDIPANADDTFKFRGFYGDYEIRVDFGNGKVKEYRIDALKANTDSVFSLRYNEGLPVTPALDQIALSKDGNAIELWFDKAIDPLSVIKNEFHVFMDSEVSIDSMVMGSADSTMYLIYLNQPVRYRQYASVFYNGESAATADGAKLYYFGPETIKNGLPGFRFAETDTTGATVILGFSKEMITTVPVNEFKIFADGVNVPIASAEYNADGNIVFELNDNVAYDQLITISYTKGTFTSSDNYILYSFGPKYVQNNVTKPTSGISDADLANLRIYPNPAYHILHIDGLQPGYSVQIYSAGGKLTKFSNLVIGQNSVSVEIRDLPAGLYLCNLVDENGKIICSKEFIKQ